uniref:NK-lysin n=1 Tax=Nibea albiflora TaxID=240163 RepID=A0AA51VIF0_NIBAL|nr:NK-lysin [Nibea albiflora]
MNTSSVLLVCVLVACSVWTVPGRNLKVYTDDQEQAEMSMVDHEVPSKIPGLCWACKWSLNKVKRVIGPNTTAERVTSRLKAICNEIGLLKEKCTKFVNGHLGELVEELTTTDDVRTICVNLKACKPKEWLDLDFESDEDPQIEITKEPTKRCVCKTAN